MTDVTWLPIPGFPYHEVTADGRVRSLDHDLVNKRGRHCFFPGRELRTTIDQDGYRVLTLVGGGRRYKTSVHRLICLAIHGEPPTPQHQVRHLNGDCSDNRPENLRWGTVTENQRDKLVHGTNTEANKTHCKNGHAFDKGNTFVNRHGHRRCRACWRQQKRDYLRKKAKAC